MSAVPSRLYFFPPKIRHTITQMHKILCVHTHMKPQLVCGRSLWSMCVAESVFWKLLKTVVGRKYWLPITTIAATATTMGVTPDHKSILEA